MMKKKKVKGVLMPLAVVDFFSSKKKRGKKEWGVYEVE